MTLFVPNSSFHGHVVDRTLYGENGHIKYKYDSPLPVLKTKREEPFPANLIANALKVQLQNGQASVALDKVHTRTHAHMPSSLTTVHMNMLSGAHPQQHLRSSGQRSRARAAERLAAL